MSNRDDGAAVAGLVAIAFIVAFVAGSVWIVYELLYGACAVPVLEAPVWCIGLIR